jgi:hypothetical protein
MQPRDECWVFVRALEKKTKEAIRSREALREIAEMCHSGVQTHWEGCEGTHPGCLAFKTLEQILLDS